MIKSKEKGEENSLWFSTQKEIKKTKISPVCEEVMEDLQRLAFDPPELLDECDWNLDSIWTLREENKDHCSVRRKDSVFKLVGSKKVSTFDKRNVYAQYFSKHPVTNEIARRALGSVEKDANPLRLRDLMDFESYSMIMSLPRKTPNDFKRINKIVKLYLSDYKAFLDILPYLVIKDDCVYNKSELETLSRLNSKYEFVGSEASILKRDVYANDNTEIMKLSYRLLDN